MRGAKMSIGGTKEKNEIAKEIKPIIEIGELLYNDECKLNELGFILFDDDEIVNGDDNEEFYKVFESGSCLFLIVVLSYSFDL